MAQLDTTAPSSAVGTSSSEGKVLYGSATWAEAGWWGPASAWLQTLFTLGREQSLYATRVSLRSVLLALRPSPWLAMAVLNAGLHLAPERNLDAGCCA